MSHRSHPAAFVGQVAVALVSCLMAVVGLVVIPASPAAAANAPITGGSVDWGIKQAFRAYVTSTAADGAHGTIDLSSSEAGPASSYAPIVTIPPRLAAGEPVLASHLYRFGAIQNGVADASTKFARVDTGGTVHFLGNGGTLDLKFDHVRVNLNGTTGVVVLDAATRTSASNGYETTDNVVFATLDLSAVTPTIAGDVATYTAIPATLTPDGSEAFQGQYPGGTALDPVTVSVRTGPYVAPEVQGRAVGSGTLRWALTREIWTNPTFNKCLAAPAVAGAFNDVDYGKATTGASFPVGAGRFDPATGATVLQLGGELRLGAPNSFQYRLANLEYSTTEAGVSTLTADVSRGFSLVNTTTCPTDAQITWQTTFENAVIVRTTGGSVARSLGVYFSDRQPDLSTNAYGLDPQFTAAVGWPHEFMILDGNPNLQGVNTGPGSLASWRRSTAAPVHILFRLGHPTGDFDATGTTDVAVFRPSNGFWYLDHIGSGAFGQAGDVPVAADYDGDGRTDLAVFRPSTGQWLVSGEPAVAFGTQGDVPVPGYYDGDGKADLAAFRPSTGTWYIVGEQPISFGATGDVPVPADYDGDGTTDIAVFRPSTGQWFVAGQASTVFGTSGDVPVPGDYDGDGTTDIAVFRPSTGQWFVAGQASTVFGTSGDVPVPGDYDGNGRTDIAVFRPATGDWYVAGLVAGHHFGANGDIPVPKRPSGS